MIGLLLMLILSLVNPDSYSWIKYIKGRIRKNKNFIVFISGPTGSSKSWTSLSIMRMVDSTSTIDNVVTSPKELMTLINSGKLKSGSCIVVEEAGVLQSARSWQSVINKAINFLLQTFRHRNFVLIMNSPYVDFIDSQTRRLFHAEFKTVGIDYKNQVSILKCYCLQYNSRTKKTYYKYLRAKEEGVRGFLPVTSWKVPKPDDELIKLYEAKKLEFTTQLNERILDEIEKADSSGKKDKKGSLSIEQSRVFELLKQKKKVSDIMVELNVKQRFVYDTMKRIQMKGYQIVPIYDDSGLDRVLYYEVG